MPTLVEFVAQLETLEEDEGIVAKPPWAPYAEARIYKMTPGGGVPAEARSGGYEYFLEVTTACEVVEDFVPKNATLEEECARLIHYAIYDA
jgi:hypothetical protein